MTVLVLSLVIVALLPLAVVGAAASLLLFKVLSAAREARAQAIAQKKHAASKKP